MIEEGPAMLAVGSGHPADLNNAVLAGGVGGGCLAIFSLAFHFLFLFPLFEDCPI